MQLSLLPWGQHHRSLLSHQEVQEAPDNEKNKQTIISPETNITNMRCCWMNTSVLNDFNVFVLLPAVAAWGLI